jgi:branched-chain amino acid transport system permease protein
LSPDLLWQLLLSGIANGTIYSVVALGFSLIYSVTGILNLAQGEFLMLGALLGVFLVTTLHLPLLAVFAIAVVVVAAIAAIFQRLALARPARLTAEAAIIITLGGSVFLRGSALAVWGPDTHTIPAFSGERPLDVLGATLLPQSLWLLGLTAVMAFGLWSFFRFTLLGKAMIACAENPTGARMVGISIERMSTVAFILSGAMGAVTGIVMTPLAFVNYETGLMIGLKGFVAALIGGMGSYGGAILGGLVLGEIESLGSVYLSSTYKDAISFALLIVVLLILPNGLLVRRRH